MVPWSPLRQPFLGWLRTDLTSEFTHFNLEIRLRKAKQSAFSFISLFAMSRWSCRPLRTFWTCTSTRLRLLRIIIIRNVLFFTVAQATDATCKMTHEPGRYMPFRCGISSSWWFVGEVTHFVHLIRLNLNSCLCPCGLTWPRSRLGGTHDYLGKNWIRSICWYSYQFDLTAVLPWQSFIPAWPTPPHASPTAPSPTAPPTWTTSHVVPTAHTCGTNFHVEHLPQQY